MLTVLLGTANPSKIEIFRSILAEVPVHLLSPVDLGISLNVSEDGATVEENAALKASAYHAASHLPTFAVDAALSIAGLSAADQPGLFVRRIYHATNGSSEVSDEEMLQHYIAAIQRLGGRGVAAWTVGAAFARDGQPPEVHAFQFQADLVTQPSPVRLPGLPLSSLMLDRRTGRYFSETDHRDREDAAFIRAIMGGYIA